MDYLYSLVGWNDIDVQRVAGQGDVWHESLGFRSSHKGDEVHWKEAEQNAKSLGNKENFKH